MQLNKITELIAFSNWSEAEKAIDELKSKIDPRQHALLQLQVLRGTKRFNEALELINVSSRMFPEELLFRLYEAKIFLELNCIAQALEAFHVCSPIIRQEEDLCDYARTYLKAGNVDRCCEIIEEIYPFASSAKTFGLIGQCFTEKKDYRKAIHFFQLALKNEPESLQWKSQLALAFRKHGDLHSAEKLYLELLKIVPQDPLVQLGYGLCLQERSYYLQAMHFYDKIGAENTKESALIFHMGFCSMHCREWKKAVHCFSAVYRNETPTSDLLFYFAYSLEKLLCWEQAEQLYTEMIQKFPKDPRGFRALAWLFGVGLSKTLSSKQAFAYAHIALKIFPTSIGLEILSACQARKGDFKKAHQIQEYLFRIEDDKSMRLKRMEAMRVLRKNQPLGEEYVQKDLVA